MDDPNFGQQPDRDAERVRLNIELENEPSGRIGAGDDGWSIDCFSACATAHAPGRGFAEGGNHDQAQMWQLSSGPFVTLIAIYTQHICRVSH